MTSINSTRSYLCLCSKCSKCTHICNGVEVPGLQVSSVSYRSHQLNDQRLEILQTLDNLLNDSDSSNQLDLSEEEEDADWGLDRQSNSGQPAQGASTSANQSDIILGGHIDSDPDIITFDTNHFFEHTLKGDNPIVIHACLIAACMAIFDHTSLEKSSWLLQAQRNNMEIHISSSVFSPETTNQPIQYTTKLALSHLPKKIHTVIRWLNIEPSLDYYTCCPDCFALYPLEYNSPICSQVADNVPGSLDLFNQNNELESTQKSRYKLPDGTQVCSAPLYKPNSLPIRRYAVQDLISWISRLMCRPSMEEELDKSLLESCKPFSEHEAVQDIHQSKMWKEFCGPDGVQFTSKTGNLTFSMFTDGINPFGNKSKGHRATDTFIVMVCLTLPYTIRFLPENLYLAAIAPGPKEPALEQYNWILAPVVSDLKQLWHKGLYVSKTPLYPNGRLIRAALLTFIADLPACRRSLGLAGHSAEAFCSLCYLPKSEINNIDQSTWIPRTSEEHRAWATAARDAKTAEERQAIFKEHDVRYSVIIELDYWRVTDYHIIDSMHNIILGLLARHVMRFWAMSEDVLNSPPPKPMTAVQLRDLVASSKTRIRNRPAHSPSEDEVGVSIANAQLAEDTSSGDDFFDPLHNQYYGWDGSYAHPPKNEVVFDLTLVKSINKLLPRINVPTWISRPIKQLGNQGHGKLKADEWRTLVTIQLPLILTVFWTGASQSNAALLHNFSHLVCLTNLALKRSMTYDCISRYRAHLHTYLEGCLKLFPHCSLVQNHHMAIHLADCLETYGPVRAWWTYPFERLMGSILKAAHNNHLGEMEVTFVKNFCRMGNLAALLRDETKLPECLRPYASQLRGIFDPQKADTKGNNIYTSQALDDDTLDQLVTRLNAVNADNQNWRSSDEWCKMSSEERINYSPVSSQVQFRTSIRHNKVNYQTHEKHPKNSVIHVVSRSNGDTLFGKIIDIFDHQRFPINSRSPVTETWLMVRYYAPLAQGMPNPFSRIGEPDLQAHLRLEMSSKPYLTHLSEVVAHCAWIVYEKGEIHYLLDKKSIALVSLSR